MKCGLDHWLGHPWSPDLNGVRIEDKDKCKKMGILFCVDNMVHNIHLYSDNGND